MRSWLLSGVCAALLLMPLTAAAVTFNVIFSGGATKPSGTITFANVGDLAPTSFLFSDNISVWTEADSVTGSWATLWNGNLPVDFLGAGAGILLTILDTVAPQGSGQDLRFIKAGASLPGPSYNSQSPGAFAYTVVPEPTTLSLVGLGMLALGLRRRRAAAH